MRLLISVKLLLLILVTGLIFPLPFEMKINETRETDRFELRIDDSEHELRLAPMMSPSFYLPASPSGVWIGGINYFFENGFLMFYKMI